MADVLLLTGASAFSTHSQTFRASEASSGADTTLGASSSMPPSAPTPRTTTGPTCHERKELAMHHYAPATANQTAEGKSPSNPFQRRLAICLVQTVFNAIIVARYAGTLYGATNHDPLQQVGVTLLFAALLGSLARMWFLTLESQTR